MKIRGHDPVHYLPHHGVRRHRLELGSLRGDLALVEAAGGEGNVEKLDVAVMRFSE